MPAVDQVFCVVAKVVPTPSFLEPVWREALPRKLAATPRLLSK